MLRNIFRINVIKISNPCRVAVPEGRVETDEAVVEQRNKKKAIEFAKSERCPPIQDDSEQYQLMSVSDLISRTYCIPGKYLLLSRILLGNEIVVIKADADDLHAGCLSATQEACEEQTSRVVHLRDLCLRTKNPHFKFRFPSCCKRHSTLIKLPF